MGSESDDPFRKGAEVEVSFEEEGFRGSWYTATVIRTVSPKTNNNKILLEFHGLMDDHQGSKPLREFVNVILVRPIPPRESSPTFKFNLSDEVDAFHNDGWWEGIVTAVLDGGSRYSVFFRSSREQIEFNQSDLRIHREWVHGKWVPPFEENQSHPPPPRPSSTLTPTPTRRLSRRR